MPPAHLRQKKEMGAWPRGSPGSPPLQERGREEQAGAEWSLGGREREEQGAGRRVSGEGAERSEEWGGLGGLGSKCQREGGASGEDNDMGWGLGGRAMI